MAAANEMFHGGKSQLLHHEINDESQTEYKIQSGPQMEFVKGVGMIMLDLISEYHKKVTTISMKDDKLDISLQNITTRQLLSARQMISSMLRTIESSDKKSDNTIKAFLLSCLQDHNQFITSQKPMKLEGNKCTKTLNYINNFNKKNLN